MKVAMSPAGCKGPWITQRPLHLIHLCFHSDMADLCKATLEGWKYTCDCNMAALTGALSGAFRKRRARSHGHADFWGKRFLSHTPPRRLGSKKTPNLPDNACAVAVAMA